jgi:hypothetical protein
VFIVFPHQGFSRGNRQSSVIFLNIRDSFSEIGQVHALEQRQRRQTRRRQQQQQRIRVFAKETPIEDLQVEGMVLRISLLLVGLSITV